MAGNILIVAQTLLPNHKCFEELPSLPFVRKCRGTLSYLTKLLAANILAKEPKWLQQHSDGTGIRQTQIGNNLVRIAAEAGYRTITLDNCILSKDETSECVRDSIITSFAEAARMLTKWREVTAIMYPGRQDLLDLIPLASELTIAKLAQCGWIMTDTCNAARKYRRLFVESIKEVALARNMNPRDIRIFQAGMYYV